MKHISFGNVSGRSLASHAASMYKVTLVDVPEGIAGKHREAASPLLRHA